MAAGKKKWIRGEDGKKKPQIVSKGLIDFEEVKEKMKGAGVELRGAGADEAPEAYKKITRSIRLSQRNYKNCSLFAANRSVYGRK